MDGSSTCAALTHWLGTAQGERGLSVDAVVDGHGVAAGDSANYTPHSIFSLKEDVSRALP